jgi:hypothetical protein
LAQPGILPHVTTLSAKHAVTRAEIDERTSDISITPFRWSASKKLSRTVLAAMV